MKIEDDLPGKLKDPDREWRFATVTLCALAALVLLYAMYGRPAYGYFIGLKVLVALASLCGAYTLWRQTKYFAPLCALLLASGAIHAFGKMHRYEWEPYNWASIVLFSITILAVVGRATLRWSTTKWRGFNSESVSEAWRRFWEFLWPIIGGTIVVLVFIYWLSLLFDGAVSTIYEWLFPISEQSASEKIVSNVAGFWLSPDKQKELLLGFPRKPSETKKLVRIMSRVWPSPGKQGGPIPSQDAYKAILWVNISTGAKAKCSGDWQLRGASVVVKITGDQCQYAQELVLMGDSVLAPLSGAEARLADSWIRDMSP